MNMTGNQHIKRAAALTATLTVALLGACSPAQQDRPNQTPDHTKDATEVTIWRNVDNVPNVSTFCAAGKGWITTLNSDSGHRGEVQRFFEMDELCGGSEYTMLDDLREG